MGCWYGDRNNLSICFTIMHPHCTTAEQRALRTCYDISGSSRYRCTFRFRRFYHATIRMQLSIPTIPLI